MHYVSVKAHKRGPAKKLHHITVTHHYTGGHASVSHEFQVHESKAAMAHLQQAMGAQAEGSAKEEAGESPEVEHKEKAEGVD